MKDDVLLGSLADDSVLFLVVKSGNMAQPQQQQQQQQQQNPQQPQQLAQSEVDLANKLLGIATQMLNLADFEGAYRAAEKALQVVQAGPKQLQVRCLSLLALVQKKRALYAEAGDLYARALALAEQMDDNIGILGELYANVGDVKRKLEQYAEATNFYDRAEKMLEKVGDKKTLVNVLIGKGLVEKKASRYEQSKSLYQRALDIEKKGTAKWAGEEVLQVLNFFLLNKKKKTRNCLQHG